MEPAAGRRREGAPFLPHAMRRLACLSLLLALAACDSAEDPPALSGLYVHSATETAFTPPATVTLALDLSASGGAFTLGPRSYYRVQGADDVRATVTGSGTYAPPSLTVSLDEIDLGGGFVLNAATFTGTVDGDGLTLTAGGRTLTFDRQ